MKENDIIEVVASYRTDFGKGFARRLRADKKIPASIHCSDGTSIDVAVEGHNLAIRESLGFLLYSKLKLNIEDKSFDVLVRDVQLHPSKNYIEHITFRNIDGEFVRNNLVIYYKNSAIAPGIKSGGVFGIFIRAVPVLCRADSIVRSVEMDISSMELGSTVKAKDIPLPDNIVLHKSISADTVISKVLGSRGKLAKRADNTAEAQEGSSATAKA